MRQWDIYLYSFEEEQPHPVVIVSNDELCTNNDIHYLNGLLCVSVRADRPLKRREAALDQANGLDWKTAVRCDFIHTLHKNRFRDHRGRVTETRQMELLRKMRFCFRWPLV